MHDYKVILTWEAIYDVTDIADYIEAEFGQVPELTVFKMTYRHR